MQSLGGEGWLVSVGSTLYVSCNQSQMERSAFVDTASSVLLEGHVIDGTCKRHLDADVQDGRNY